MKGMMVKTFEYYKKEFLEIEINEFLAKNDVDLQDIKIHVNTPGDPEWGHTPTYFAMLIFAVKELKL